MAENKPNPFPGPDEGVATGQHSPGEGHPPKSDQLTEHDNPHVVHFDMSQSDDSDTPSPQSSHSGKLGENGKSLHRQLSEKSPLLLSSRDMSVGVDPGFGFRHIVTFLCFLGCGIAYALRSHLSVALVAMVKSQDQRVISNTTEMMCPIVDEVRVEVEGEEGEFDWDAGTQGIILSAFFYGALATQLLGGIIAERFGGKRVFGFGVFLISVFTLVTPPIARANVTLLVIARVFEGFGEGMTIPAMYVILSKWSPRLERTQFGAFAMAGGNIGNVFGLALTGILSDESVGGWPVAFYVFGTLGLIWVLAWCLFVHESPASHPNISITEKTYIVTTAGDRVETPPTPWRAILTSLPLWAIVAAHFGKNWVYFTLLTSLPIYMKQVLRFDISQNGILSSLPYLAMWFVEIVGSQVLDLLRRRKLISTTDARKTVNTLGIILTAIFLVAEGYVGCDKVLAVTMLCLAMAGLGLTSSGFQVNHLDIAPAFAGTLMGITNNIATIPGIVSPSVVTSITEAKPYVWRWRIIFYIAAFINLVGGFLFTLLASGKEQAWARQTKPYQKDDYHSQDYQSQEYSSQEYPRQEHSHNQHRPHQTDEEYKDPGKDQL